MSGGFFRGTSADQDTRFSNKQAKLMKSQKFAPELDHLVDMTKVKMDVIRPWIANRVTELLGFEDEVLINFIYGLLDGKEVNGKEVQISLTGFMEKNTGKFMKELWMLLLSAQKNASGVPQQFLDAKEEETRKKKVEADRIANEIQKKKEKESRELEQERLKTMDGAVEMKATNAALDLNSKAILAKDSSIQSEDGKGPGERNGVRGRNRISRSPRSAARSPSPRRGSPSRSISKSHSNSRSYSDGRQKSRSVSLEARRRSISSDRVYHTSKKQSITPRRRHSPWFSHSPSRRRSSYLRRRSRSRSLRRSPSPFRRKLHSPFRRKSPSPMRRRSPSPVQRRRSPSSVRRRRSPSPIRRRRSPSPIRRRRSPSPVRRRRSPSPVRRRRSPSPIRRRRSPSPVWRRRSPSPVRRRRSPPMGRGSLSPVQHGSPSPVRCRSPSLVHRSSPSQVRRRYQRSPLTPQNRSPLTPQNRSPSPIRQRSPVPARMRPQTPSRRRSPSPYESSSPSPTRRRTLSPVRRKSPIDYRRSPVQSPREKIRTRENLSPAAHRRSSSLRSPQRDPKDQNDSRNQMSAFSPSPDKSPTVSESPPRATRKRSSSEDRRSLSPYESPVRRTRDATLRDGSSSPPQKPREWKPRQDGPDTSKGNKDNIRTREDGDHKSVSSRRSMPSSTSSRRKESPLQVNEDYSPERVASGRHAAETRSQSDKMDLRKRDQDSKSEKSFGRGVRPGTFDQERSPTSYKESLPGERQLSTYPGAGKKSDERNHSRSSNGKDSDRRRKSENATMVGEKVDYSNRSDGVDSGSEESYKHRTENKEKRKHKKYEREEVASDNDNSYDSEIERKQAKRRRKEEKKLRKEEKRRWRDERRRKREERRAEKLKLKNQNDADGSDGEHVSRRESHPSDDEATESEQKRLEIELRNKALESIKAKKISSR